MHFQNLNFQILTAHRISNKFNIFTFIPCLDCLQTKIPIDISSNIYKTLEIKFMNFHDFYIH